jgi:zinc finger CCHC domain-containing protein 9
VVDPEEERAKTEAERNKRIEKKLGKKQQTMTELKNWKRHQKRCLKCGSREHLLSECPTTKGGFCYKCGSQDHSHNDCEKVEYALADCFYCGKKGHIARECPDNEKGLYKKGGSCFGCGSVRHTMKNCPVRLQQVGNRPATFANKDEF